MSRSAIKSLSHLFHYAGIRLAVLVAFAVLPVYQVQAIEPRERVASAMAFTESLLDRKIASLIKLSIYAGEHVFKIGETAGAAPAGGGSFSGEGILRKDLQVGTLETVDPYPVTENSILVKLMVVRDHVYNINYRGPTIDSEIGSFTVSPAVRDEIARTATSIGGGLPLGYLLSEELPHFRELVDQVEWVAARNGTGVSGTHKDWRIEFQFPDETATQFRRIEILPVASERTRRSRRQGCTIDIDEWGQIADISYPKKMTYRHLMLRDDNTLTTSVSAVTLESVGPIVSLSDRVGDFFTNVPNGRRVQVDDYPGIDFIWEDGEVVRKVDRVRLDSLIGQPFFESPSRRFVIIAAGIVILGLCLWGFWKKTAAKT